MYGIDAAKTHSINWLPSDISGIRTVYMKISVQMYSTGFIFYVSEIPNIDGIAAAL